MISQCANPGCSIGFDHRRGRLYRFPKCRSNDGRPANTHSVEHFWLCASCSKIYSLTYDESLGVTIGQPSGGDTLEQPRQFIAASSRESGTLSWKT